MKKARVCIKLIKHFALILSDLIVYIAQLYPTTEIQILLEEVLFNHSLYSVQEDRVRKE